MDKDPITENYDTYVLYMFEGIIHLKRIEYHFQVQASTHLEKTP